MKPLAEIIRDLPIEIRTGPPETPVEEIVEDSRRARRGSLFVARPGSARDGRLFIADAVAGGAIAVLTERGTLVPEGVAHLVSDDVTTSAARLAERFHGDPSRALAVAGVTGTNGKTTVTWLISHLLRAAGRRCGVIGTVAVDLGDDAESRAAAGARIEPGLPAHTTPPAVELSALLHRMVDHGACACAMEVSSHALDQGRTAGLHFAGAVFTNLTGDHLDYHRTEEAYALAKSKLFASLDEGAFAVINADDAHTGAMIAAAARAHIVTTSLRGRSADAWAEIGAMTDRSTRARFDGPFGSMHVDLPHVGRHNVANALQAAVAAHMLGVDRADLELALATAPAPPGRLERVTAASAEAADAGPTVLVDYAHTDDALANVLSALRPLVRKGGRLRVVFGCGGDRDRSKRPRMAAIAWRFADDVIVTSDNPRSEDPERILDEVMEGVPAERIDRTLRVCDRAEAIRRAIFEAAPDDLVLIAGKGHEDYQIIGTEKLAFDDRIVARAALESRRGMQAGRASGGARGR